MALRLSRTCLGTASVERECNGFHVALRRATVPFEAVPEHAHDTAHLILAVDDGYQSDAVGASAWRGPAMLVYNPPGTVHRDRFAVDGGRFVAIDFPAGFEPRRIVDPIVIRANAARTIVSTVLAATLDGDAALDIEDGLLALSAALSGGERRDPEPPPWLATAVEAIGDLAGDVELKVRDVARLAGVHPVHLARVFTRHFTCSPADAIRRRRVERAAGLLTGGRSMADISQDCGFADQSHMTRCFRAAYGTTPSAFRAAFD